MLTRIPHRGEIIVNTEGRRFRCLGLLAGSDAIIKYEPVEGGIVDSAIARFEHDREGNAMLTIEGDHAVETRGAFEARTVLEGSRVRR